MVLIALASLGCVSCDVRLSGAGRRRKQKLDKKNFWEENVVPLKYQEQDEPDAEPKGRNGGMSIPGNELTLPIVPMKALMPKHPVTSTDDGPQDLAAPGSDGFVAQQTAEVERVLHIFRMNTEGQVHLVDEEGLEQQNRESRVVPTGLVRSCTVGLEGKIQQNPLRRVSFA